MLWADKLQTLGLRDGVDQMQRSPTRDRENVFETAFLKRVRNNVRYFHGKFFSKVVAVPAQTESIGMAPKLLCQRAVLGPPTVTNQ